MRQRDSIIAGYSDARGTVAAAAPQRVDPAAAGRRDDPVVGLAVPASRYGPRGAHPFDYRLGQAVRALP
jgi:hypothetical protein